MPVTAQAGPQDDDDDEVRVMLKMLRREKTLVAYKIFINSHLTGLIAMKGWAANFTRKLADN